MFQIFQFLHNFVILFVQRYFTPSSPALSLDASVFLAAALCHKCFITVLTYLTPMSHLFHCVKSVCIWSYSGLYFPALGMNTKRYSIFLGIQSECGKIWTRITPNKATFYAVFIPWKRPKTKDFLKFSGGIDKEHLCEIG